MDKHYGICYFEDLNQPQKEKSAMAIFYMTTNIIGRSSGRSAIGAAAYRRSTKMQSIAHAAYQRGEKIIEKGDKINHDYRSKGGVAHSEIMLPKDALLEFTDAQILWNTVESSEKRKDAQLAREIIVALPKEFNLEENIEVLQAYLQENFVNIGMIADYSIHDKKDGNPHAHIMLTMQNVSPDGFGYKNTDWNKKALLLKWRKAWAHTNNEMFKRKGLTKRIDHRSYKNQGKNRLPLIHMGHAATALERQGIRTEKGDYNREIQQRNSECETKTQEQRKDNPQEADIPAAANVTSDNTQSTLEKEYTNTKHITPTAPNHILREIEENRETYLDKEQIEILLEKMTKPPEFVRERLQQERIKRRLNNLTKEDFPKIIKKLPEPQSRILIKNKNKQKKNF
jgi:ATP-dependent exoDNAse (exonuclease V) alpha subunit